ncbi:MAG: hypothetical protein K2O65_09730 [Lachnospiraceae bacterium]|nr:hypothetical protein [Lachnospiraceae bacterium]
MDKFDKFGEEMPDGRLTAPSDFCPFYFRKIYPKTSNYGKIAVSNKCQSKEQNEEKDKLLRGGSIGLWVYLWVDWKRDGQ